MNFPPITSKDDVKWYPVYGHSESPARRQDVSQGWKTTFILIHVIAFKMPFVFISSLAIAVREWLYSFWNVSLIFHLYPFIFSILIIEVCLWVRKTVLRHPQPTHNFRILWHWEKTLSKIYFWQIKRLWEKLSELVLPTGMIGIITLILQDFYVN